MNNRLVELETVRSSKTKLTIKGPKNAALYPPGASHVYENDVSYGLTSVTQATRGSISWVTGCRVLGSVSWSAAARVSCSGALSEVF